MKKYSAEERQAALELVESQGIMHASKELQITDTTLRRWRHEAELQKLVSQFPRTETDVPQDDRGEQASSDVAEKQEVHEEPAQRSNDAGIAINRERALGEALATIDELQQENARLIAIIKQQRIAIRNLVEVV